MNDIILVVVAIAIFVTGIVSPHAAGKLQHKTNKKAHWLKRLSNWLWDPLTWWAKKSIEWTRIAIVKLAEWGKKTRYKLSCDRKTKRSK